ncbi:MAG: ATP-grasp domain-containing protein [Thermomicrobiales bacterium]
MVRCNILFTSAGRRVSLIQSFRSALNELGIDGSIVTGDLRGDAPARFVGDVHEQLPRVDAESYVDRLKAVCVKHSIQLVVPLIDTELHILARHRDAFQQLGVCLLISSPAVTDIAYDKRRTMAFFESARALTPRLIEREDFVAENIHFPLMLKPARGSGSVGVTKIHNRHELDFFLGYIPDPVVQEFIQGDEYTLDVLTDFSGRVRSIVPRLRLETRAGEVSKGMTVKNKAVMSAGARVVEALPGPIGPITVQCFMTPDGDISFIEINPRFGGGFPLSAQAGANFPRWIIEWVLGRDPVFELNAWQDGLMMLRYDDAVFATKQEVESV